MSAVIYKMVTERIMKKLEEGVVPWRMPWVGCGAVNWLTQKPYSGINALLLDPGEYLTWNQVKSAGGKVKEEEAKKGHIVIFYKPLEILEDAEDPESKKKIPLLRYYRVWHINQCEGIKTKRKDNRFEHDIIEQAEKIVQGYKDAPVIMYASGRAVYKKSEDKVSVPPLEDYPKREEFYCTKFHEMVHSTGHPKRLNRKELTDAMMFGDHQYTKEELIAELGASMLCAVAGIENQTIDNSASYIGSWLKKLKNDPKFIVQASAQAQRAVDYILGRKAQGADFEEAV